MGQHVEIVAIYRDTDIIARFRVRQLRVVVLVLPRSAVFLSSLIRSFVHDVHYYFLEK